MSQSPPPAASVCGLDLPTFMLKAEEFHGHVSPGLMLGGFLLEAAWDRLGDTPYINAVVETVVCLPDVVQMLTPCTLGNGFMQVLDWGKFALTLYDRQTLSGYRAWADRQAIAAQPVIAGWFLRTGQTLPKEEVVEHIARCGPGLARVKPVSLTRPLKPTEKVATGPCPRCGESYPLRLGAACLACQGQAYYRD
ncbi:MAG: FmdE family protein [Pseudomonadota bacterium]